MTNHWTDIKNADLVLIMGGNAAEAHPCGFKWVTEAKAHNQAKLVVVDPRFTRSAAVADCTHRSALVPTSPSLAG
jgi:formate dehydrogenase major subunit